MEDVYILKYRVNVNAITHTSSVETTLYFPSNPAAQEYQSRLAQAANLLGIMDYCEFKIEKAPLQK